MPYPDNFDGAAFDRCYGSPASDIAGAELDRIAAHDAPLTAGLAADIAALIRKVRDTEFLGAFPVPGHDPHHVIAALSDLMPQGFRA